MKLSLLFILFPCLALCGKYQYWDREYHVLINDDPKPLPPVAFAKDFLLMCNLIFSLPGFMDSFDDCQLRKKLFADCYSLEDKEKFESRVKKINYLYNNDTYKKSKNLLDFKHKNSQAYIDLRGIYLGYKNKFINMLSFSKKTAKLFSDREEWIEISNRIERYDAEHLERRNRSLGGCLMECFCTCYVPPTDNTNYTEDDHRKILKDYIRSTELNDYFNNSEIKYFDVNSVNNEIMAASKNLSQEYLSNNLFDLTQCLLYWDDTVPPVYSEFDPTSHKADGD